MKFPESNSQCEKAAFFSLKTKNTLKNSDTKGKARVEDILRMLHARKEHHA